MRKAGNLQSALWRENVLICHIWGKMTIWRISAECLSYPGEERFPKNETADSLVPEGAVQFDWDDMTYRYEEYLPVGLKESTNLYRTHRFIFTDAEMDQCMQPVYKVEGRNLLFF